MKKILPLFALLAFLWGCTESSTTTTTTADKQSDEMVTKDVEKPSEEPTEEEAAMPDPDATGNFGAAVSAEGAMPSSDLISKLAGQDSVHVKLEGSISSCCQAKGCWMTMPLTDDEDLMIKFKDYGFFVPKNSTGKPAVIEGWAYHELVSIEELRHYAMDAGKSPAEVEAITEDEERITFMADGVLIK
ncbi:MAG TPA: DUF4920 domain-containing protein [Bacteroidetes bacterium]|nr:DUF4920 domain-containing protein [Bacteroidota bacterium]